MMKIEYDEDADAAYIYIKTPIKPGEVKKSQEMKKDVVFDYDQKGNLVGVEILNASKVIGKKALLSVVSAK